MSCDRAYEDRLDHVADALRLASGPTAGLFADVIGSVCTRLPVPANAGEAARIGRLIEAGAPLDAVLALVECELPQWRLRRLVLDGGRWCCSLSTQPSLPIGFDDTADGEHDDIVLAILTAFVAALRMSRTAPGSSAPVMRNSAASSDALCCDGFL